MFFILFFTGNAVVFDGADQLLTSENMGDFLHSQGGFPCSGVGVSVTGPSKGKIDVLVEVLGQGI